MLESIKLETARTAKQDQWHEEFMAPVVARWEAPKAPRSPASARMNAGDVLVMLMAALVWLLVVLAFGEMP